jgi:endonuclease/exonuclease/phosphatase family metal-dependent hydrolase
MLMTLAGSYGQNYLKNETKPSVTGLKILSWNIYMLPYISLFNRNGHRAKLIGQQLKDSDYQIIVFQEAFSSKCRNILKRELSVSFPYQYGPANMPLTPLRTSSGLWVVSKLPLTLLKSIRFKHATSFDRIAHKGAALFEGEFNGNKFQLLATHLQSENPDRIAAGQCREISALLKEFYTPNEPQLLCGDFNTEMSDYKNYTQMLQTLDADNGKLDGKLQSTYDERNNTLIAKPQGKSEIIDYILTRNTHLIDKINRNIVEFYHHDNAIQTHLSDHYAMEAVVQFVPRPNGYVPAVFHANLEIK